MHYLSWLDYTIIGLYFVFLLCIGLYMRKKAAESLDDYYLGGRKLPWWALGFSGMAMWVNIVGTMIIVAFIYMIGPKGLYIAFRGGAGLVMVFMLLWTGKWHRRSGCMTLAEWMMFRFGKSFGAHLSRIAQVVAIILLTIGLLGMTIKGLGIFLSLFLPFTPFQCCLIFVGMATVYTAISGFYGVVYSDIVQGLFIFIGAISVAFLAGFEIPDLTSFSDTAAQVTGNQEWASSAPEIKTKFLPGYEQYSNLLSFALSYLFLNILLGMSVSGAEPMYFGAKSDRDCGLMSAFWTVIMSLRWPLIMAFAVFGIYLVRDSFPDTNAIPQAAELIRAHLGEIPAHKWYDTLAHIVQAPSEYSPELINGLKDLFNEGWKSKTLMVSFEGGVNPETIMPAVLMKSIPSGVRGIIFIALIAAAMSTLDSSINKAGGYFVNDLYKRYLRPKAKNRELITASYLFTFILVIAGFLLAYTLKGVTDIWEWLVMGLNAGLVAPCFLRLYWWRFNGEGFAIGMFSGMTIAILQRAIAPGLDPRIQLLIVFAATLLCTIAATYCFKPTDWNTLKKFYMRTRPFGLWKPLKDTLSPREKKLMESEHKNDIIAVPFVMGWQVTLFLMPMQLVIHSFNAFFITLGISVFCMVGMYFFWYSKLPPADGPVESYKFDENAE
ncbi:sodium:solute symporter family transporter [Sedimentisphaera salicampi]|uniref:Na(+)/glucose symporter n=1 Tax=Sedimentisphaera salicampi TaxID=1941349 RepID=A0A1W6LJ64_9BACT|nr:sodium:solute symporter [Sedimentisphaera salicampi]ARN55786.1 Na(+)/glucose symporter [Sedimentisphaera salicampi]OXU15979.1 Na(+)/glucose symporter [Sedimentisphaera salicampi]